MGELIREVDGSWRLKLWFWGIEKEQHRDIVGLDTERSDMTVFRPSNYDFASDATTMYHTLHSSIVTYKWTHSLY